jgi:hypothetical protein
MNWALKIDSVRHSDLGTKLKTQSKSLTKLVEDTANRLLAVAGEKPRFGLRLYDQISGKSPLNPTGRTEDATKAKSNASAVEV